jgi:fructokinase
MPPLLGAVEAGGTKFVCIVGTGPGDVRARLRLATTTPAETLGRTFDFFREAAAAHGPLHAVGIGSFGPVDLEPTSPAYGRITTTPKPGWAGVDVVGAARVALGVPIGFDTDVNAAALGEWRWGAAQGLRTIAYLTVGTGIGGGALIDGRPMHGLLHPEMGHTFVPHDRAADPYGGCCPFHGDCLEGLASGPSMQARWGVPADALAPDHPAWALEANYLAYAVANIVLTLSPQRVVLGGGVMTGSHLLSLVRARVAIALAGYVQAPELGNGLDRYVVAPGLGADSGVMGGLVLAEQAAGA